MVDLHDTTEEWRSVTVPGFEHYMVSNLGRVRSAKRLLRGRYQRYHQVNLTGSRGKRAFYVHRLVALSFIQVCDGRAQVNHIDGNKHNNNVCNLEWCTARENVKHSVKYGMHPSGDRHWLRSGKYPPRIGELNSNAKLSPDAVREIRNLRGLGTPLKTIAEIFGVQVWAIGQITTGKKWAHII